MSTYLSLYFRLPFICYVLFDDLFKPFIQGCDELMPPSPLVNLFLHSFTEWDWH